MADRWEDWFLPGERLLWEGAPAPGQRHWFRNIFFTAFGIPFLMAGLFVSGMGLGYAFAPDKAWEIALGILLTAFGIPFIAVGGGMVFGGWLSDYLAPTRTRFALSDRAGYIATRYWNRNLDVIPIHADTRIELEEGQRGIGSIYFHFESTVDSDGDRSTQKKGFEGIADVHGVFKLIRDVKAAAAKET